MILSIKMCRLSSIAQYTLENNGACAEVCQKLSNLTWVLRWWTVPTSGSDGGRRPVTQSAESVGGDVTPCFYSRRFPRWWLSPLWSSWKQSKRRVAGRTGVSKKKLSDLLTEDVTSYFVAWLPCAGDLFYSSIRLFIRFEFIRVGQNVIGGGGGILHCFINTSFIYF